jgi:hypothetical protein
MLPPPNKITNEQLNAVQEHLASLPAYESHYCRKETSKKYLPPYFTVTKTYNMYCETTEKPISYTKYLELFKKSNIAKVPRKILAKPAINTRVIQKVRLQHLCRIEKCLYSIEIHRILHKYIKLFFNVIAVESATFLQSGHQLLYASVIDLYRQLFQPLP